MSFWAGAMVIERRRKRIGGQSSLLDGVCGERSTSRSKLLWPNLYGKAVSRDRPTE